MPTTPAPPPWTLTVPRGAHATTLDNLAERLGATGLDVIRKGLTYQVDRRADPPPLIVPLNWRMTAAGLIGSSQTLRDHWRTWPSVAPILNPAGAEAALRDFEARPKPANMFQLAEVLYAAEGIMLAAADADMVVRRVSRIAARFLQWYPGGQMIPWGINYQHIAAGLPGHMLAAAGSGGWGSVQRALKDNRRAL